MIQKIYSKGKIRARKLKEFEKRKPCYMLEFWSNEAVEFLQSIYPYLIIKKDQADVAFLYQNTYRRKGFGKGSFGKKEVAVDVLLLRGALDYKLKRMKHEKIVD